MKTDNPLAAAFPAKERVRKKVASARAQSMYPIYGSMCFYCGVQPGISADHLIPRAAGGPNHFTNMVPACEECNQAKGSRMPTNNEMAKARALLRKYKSTQA